MSQRIDVPAVLGEYGVVLGGESGALVDLEALAEAHGWQASTERFPLAPPGRRCRALLVRSPGAPKQERLVFVARGSGPTEVLALSRALAMALSREAREIAP